MAATLSCVYDNIQMFPLTGSPQPLPKPYLPAIPPAKTLKPSYDRFMLDAPWIALSGTRYDTRTPPKSPNVPKGQKRALVGLSNRWRLPQNVCFDLLGSSQAMKSIFLPYNKTLTSVKTAESAEMSCNQSSVACLPGASPSRTNLPKKVSSRSCRNITSKSSVQCEPASLERITTDTSAISDVSKHAVIKNQLQQIRLDRNVAPLAYQEPTPIEMFLHHSQAATCGRSPDLILYALDTVWELHAPYFQKSALLRDMVKKATELSVLPSNNEEDNENGDNQHKATGHSAVDVSAVKSAVGVSKSKANLNSVLQLVHTPSFVRALVLKLRAKDPLLSKQVFAVALASFYVDHMKVDENDAVGVLAAATLLDYPDLQKTCVDVMLTAISVSTACVFHSVATKYNQLSVIDACERWLELNLVPQLSLQIYLRHLRQDVLEKLLKSNRLFTFNEYSLYKLLCYWIFLHQHSSIRAMSSWGSVVTWFMSLPKTCAFLDRPEGQRYTNLLRAVRFITITESVHLDEIHRMNIIPQSWLLHIYSQNYHALQGGGGDMSLLTKFENGAVRFGFILEQNLQYHSEVLSLHGFHFEMKAIRESDGKYIFYLQRLRPNDQILSFRTSERQTFSLRQDREVRYSIRVQWIANEASQVYTSGILSKAFGFTDKAKKSEVVTLHGLPLPVFATFSIMFPTS